MNSTSIEKTRDNSNELKSTNGSPNYGHFKRQTSCVELCQCILFYRHFQHDHSCHHVRTRSNLHIPRPVSVFTLNKYWFVSCRLIIIPATQRWQYCYRLWHRGREGGGGGELSHMVWPQWITNGLYAHNAKCSQRLVHWLDGLQLKELPTILTYNC